MNNKRKAFKTALHTWTIHTTRLETCLDAAAKAGFDAIEIRRSDIVDCYEQGLSKDDVISMMRDSDILIGVLGTEYGWFFTPPEEQERLFGVLRETCEIAKAVGCDMIMSAPGQVTGTVDDAIASTRIAGAIVAEYGLKLALEFNSQHPVVNRTAVLREIIEGAGHVNCGMLLDAYHLHRGEGISAGLDGVSGEELFAFQYSDVPRHPTAGVRRPIDRLVPGKGVIDWDKLFDRLSEIGYDGYLSYEAPNPDLWERSPYEVCVEGVEVTRALLSSAVREKIITNTKEMNMANISVKDASTIVDAAIAKGRENSFEPLTVVVLDAGGHLVAAKREDESGILRVELATGKSYGALGFGLGSRELAKRSQKVPGFMSAASDASGGRCVPAPGGVLIKNLSGKVMGAVGISGDTGDNDEICAIAGIEAAGLIADGG